MAPENAILPPSADSFYDLPPLHGEAGSLVRTRTVPVEHREVGVARQVVYLSTGARGQRTAVSGTLLEPARPWTGAGPRPVLSYGVGVHGLDRDAAPSHLLRRGAEPELEAVLGALRRGWAVVISDGDGLGMPGPHTYGASAPGAHAMLDLVRAAREAGAVDPGAPVLVWGYSEGGRYAVRAAELHPTYAPDLRLVAAAAGGVPSDLRAMAISLDDGPFAGLNLAVLVGLLHAHQDPALATILSPAGVAAAELAASLDVAGIVVELGVPLSTHTVREQPWDEPVWRDLLHRERCGHHRPDVPVLLYHSAQDDLVPYELGRELYDAYRECSAAVEWRALETGGHLENLYTGADQAITWLEQQLTGHGEDVWLRTRQG